MTITNKERDRIQVNMFQSVYKANRNLSPEARFARAIVLSCDEFVDDAIERHEGEFRDYLKYLDEIEAYRINDRMDRQLAKSE